MFGEVALGAAVALLDLERQAATGETLLLVGLIAGAPEFMTFQIRQSYDGFPN
jgi:hypothetical protein